MGTSRSVVRPVKRAAAKRRPAAAKKMPTVAEKVPKAKTEVPAAAKAEPAAKPEYTGPPLRPSQCRTYMRKELALRFPGIVAGFIEGAMTGNCQHVKLATEFLDGKTKRGSGERDAAMRAGQRTLKRLVQELEQIPE